MMVRLSIVVVVAVAAVARAESEAELAYSPEELQGWRNVLKVCCCNVILSDKIEIDCTQLT